MAKKRKLRSSEPESSNITAEPEQPQHQTQPEDQPQIEAEPEQEQIEEQQLEEQNNQEHEPETEQGQPQNMDEDEEEEDEDGEQLAQEGGEALAMKDSNDVASTEQAPLEVNGGGNGEEADDGGPEELEEEPVEKILEPFGKEHLVVLIKEAVAKYPELMESVHKLADADPAHRKIFVHGLGWDTNAETLTSVFGKYGEIEDCKAVCDKVSGKSKGYGFILFKHRSGARKALKQPQKKIGNRMTSCQLASAGPVPAPPPAPMAPPVSEYTLRKIFVSNVSAELDPQKLHEFFSKYGEIEDGPLGLDKQSGKPRGFCLFVYKTIESAKKALEEPHKNFEGHTLHCQKAVDGPKQSKPYYQQHHHHQQYHSHSSRKEKTKYSAGGGAGPGHLMAPSGPSMGFNPAVAAPALTPALGQALTALLATQGAGLGITNLLGGLGAQMNQGVPPMMNNPGYGNQSGGGYGNQPGMQGGYQNPQMGQGQRQQLGGAPYMGHGR